MAPTNNLLEISDPMERALTAGQLIDEHQVEIVELSRLRRRALDELITDGRTQTEIAKTLGMTRARVSQLLSSGPGAERAFLGSGDLTIALGGKLEADKADPGAVVSEGALAAFQLLSNLARGLDLEAESEVIAPPGFMSLNRPNLVVICGPRLSPLLGQVLESDPRLRFAKDDDGWHFMDLETGTIYRSPMDGGESSDIGYLARLPRPDGRGTFLYMAGIHAIGSVGVAHYLDDHLAELYEENKTRRFSMLISCDFDPPHRITASQAVTPAYSHD